MDILQAPKMLLYSDVNVIKIPFSNFSLLAVNLKDFKESHFSLIQLSEPSMSSTVNSQNPHITLKRFLRHHFSQCNEEILSWKPVTYFPGKIKFT